MSVQNVFKEPNKGQPQNSEVDQIQLERIVKRRLCRLCRCGESQDQFITPCKCQGPFAYVHKRCMKSWLEMTKQQKCDICRFVFRVTLHRRTMTEWLTKKNESIYLRPFIELVTRLFNVAFISLLSISLIICHDCGGLSSVNEHNQVSVNVSRPVLIVILPAVRLTLILYVLTWYGRKISKEFYTWQQSNPRIQVHSNDNFHQAPNEPLNSFVRVSGLKYIQKYLKQNPNTAAVL